MESDRSQDSNTHKLWHETNCETTRLKKRCLGANAAVNKGKTTDTPTNGIDELPEGWSGTQQYESDFDGRTYLQHNLEAHEDGMRIEHEVDGAVVAYCNEAVNTTHIV